MLEDYEELKEMIINEIVEDLENTAKCEENKEVYANVDVDGVAIGEWQHITILVGYYDVISLYSWDRISDIDRVP